MFSVHSSRTILITTVLVFFSGMLRAENVEHHGHMADPDGGHLECLSCHDGTLAHSVEYCSSAECDGRSNHPVDRRYPPRGKEREYAPAGQLSILGIKLYMDKVSCISCHNLENNGKNHLVQVKDLCMSCHVSK